jgi:hypothetical protein
MAEKVVKEETDERNAVVPQEQQPSRTKLEQEESKEAPAEEEEEGDLEMLEMLEDDDDEEDILLQDGDDDLEDFPRPQVKLDRNGNPSFAEGPPSSSPARIQSSGGKTITDKEFYKAMQKLKDRGNNAVPPKKSASAYILFGKEVIFKSLGADNSTLFRNELRFSSGTLWPR